MKRKRRTNKQIEDDKKIIKYQFLSINSPDYEYPIKTNYKNLSDKQKEAIGKLRKKRIPRNERRLNRMKKSSYEQQFYNEHGYLP